MHTKSKYCFILLTAVTILIFTLAFINMNTSTNLPQDETSTQAEVITSTEEPTTEKIEESTEIKVEEVKFGDEEIGFIELNDDYTINNLSDLVESSHYLIGMNDKLCVGILLQDISFKEAVITSSKIEGYEDREEVVIRDDESFLIKQIHLSNKEGMYCTTTLINELKANKIIAIAISSATPTTPETFQNDLKAILDTYTLNNEKIIIEQEEINETS